MKNDKITFPSNLTGDYKFSSIKLSIFKENKHRSLNTANKIARQKTPEPIYYLYNDNQQRAIPIQLILPLASHLIQNC